MFSRKQYVNGDCSHQQYYGQLVNDRTIRVVVSRLGKNRLMSGQKIPLAEWDRFSCILPLALPFGALGDYPTLCGWVCVAKEAARQFVESEYAKYAQ